MRLCQFCHWLRAHPPYQSFLLGHGHFYQQSLLALFCTRCGSSCPQQWNHLEVSVEISNEQMCFERLCYCIKLTSIKNCLSNWLSIFFSDANAFCNSATSSSELLKPVQYYRIFEPTTFYFGHYLNARVPATVTPPVPADTKTIEFADEIYSSHVKYYSDILVEADYGSVEMCGYVDIKTIHMIECDSYEYTVNAVVCSYLR